MPVSFQKPSRVPAGSSARQTRDRLGSTAGSNFASRQSRNRGTERCIVDLRVDVVGIVRRTCRATECARRRTVRRTRHRERIRPVPTRVIRARVWLLFIDDALQRSCTSSVSPFLRGTRKWKFTTFSRSEIAASTPLRSRRTGEWDEAVCRFAPDRIRSSCLRPRTTEDRRHWLGSRSFRGCTVARDASGTVELRAERP